MLLIPVFPLVVALDATAAPSADPIVVFAAASLTEALTDVATAWNGGGRDVRFQFESSGTLARQIRLGAEADLFLPASSEWLDALAPLERFDWLGNRLVCVVPAGATAGEFSLAGMASLVLAGDQVPAGSYARAALATLGLRPPARTVYAANVRDVLAKVVAGAGEGGIVYATDAVGDVRVRVAFEFPPESHPTIVYPVGLLTERGRRFYEQLRRPESADAARRRGFEVLTSEASSSR